MIMPNRQPMHVYVATVSDGRTVHVTAPSPQRALARVTRYLADKHPDLTVTGVSRASDTA
ncbi:hypothetical protein [Streptomyces sp. NPDC005385]|uniref:hypothetical protein n=1 Tax=Streptomyces sp. NPDC005385 TaxID=3157039 RepID=UPI0033B1C295